MFRNLNNYIMLAIIFFALYLTGYFAKAQSYVEKQNAAHINLLENAGFESNLAKWSKVGSLGTFTTTSSTIALLQGKYSAHLTFGSSTQSAAACSNYYDPQSLKNSNGEMGFSYRFSSVNPASGTVFVEDASGTVLSQMDLDITLLGEKRDVSKLFAFNDKPTRLCMLGKGTSAVPWGIILDNTWLGSPRNVTQGPIVSGKQEQYTPTINGFGTTTNRQFYWSRVGSKIFIEGSFTVGTPTATGAFVTLPDGLKVAAKYLSGFAYVVGEGGTSVSSQAPVAIIRSDYGNDKIYFARTAVGNSNLTAQNGDNISSTGGAFTFKAELEIDGWATTGTAFTGMCKDVLSCRNIFNADVASNGTISTTTNTAGWLTSCSGSAPYTCNFKSGLFAANPICVANTTATGGLSSVNSTSTSAVTINTVNSATQANTSLGFKLVCFRTTDWIDQKVIQGYLNEQNLLVSYYASTNKSASTTVPINYDTKIIDATNCNCVTTGSNWKFTAPRVGHYEVSFSSTSTDNPFFAMLYKNGIVHTSGYYATATQGGSSNIPIYLNSGDYIEIRPTASVTVTGGSLVTGGRALISIKWIGN